MCLLRSLLHSLGHGARPIYRGACTVHQCLLVARENSRALVLKRPAQSLSYVGPIVARHSSIWSSRGSATQELGQDAPSVITHICPGLLPLALLGFALA